MFPNIYKGKRFPICYPMLFKLSKAFISQSLDACKDGNIKVNKQKFLLYLYS